MVSGVRRYFVQKKPQPAIFPPNMKFLEKVCRFLHTNKVDSEALSIVLSEKVTHVPLEFF